MARTLTRREVIKTGLATGVAVLGARALGRRFGMPAVLGAPAKTTLTVLYQFQSDNDMQAFQQLAKTYEQRNSDIQIEIQPTTLGRLPEALQSRIASQDLPNLGYIVGNRLPILNKWGLLADVSGFLPKNVREEFVPYRWDEVQYGQKVVGVPGSHGVRALAYNVDYLEKAGITAPNTPDQTWTWEQLENVAQTLMRVSGARFGVMFERNSFDHWAGVHYQNGGTLLNQDLTAATINSPEGLGALEWAIDLHRRKIAPPGVLEGTENPVPLFASGAVGLWMIGAWMIPALQSQMTRFRYGFTYMPKRRRAAIVTTGGCWTVFKTRRAEEAGQFLAFLATEESIGKLAAARVQTPARKKVKAFKWDMRPELADFFTKQADAAYQAQLQRETIHAFYGATRDALIAEVGLAVSGQKAPRAAMESMERITNDELRLLRQ